MMFFNTETKEFPRFIGDLQLIYPELELTSEIPAPWVVVNYTDPPTYSANQTVSLTEPKLINDEWQMTWSVRDLTPEELQQIDESRKQMEDLNKRP